MNKYEVMLGYGANTSVEVEADIYTAIKKSNPHNHRGGGVYVFLVGDEIVAEFPCGEVKMIKKIPNPKQVFKINLKSSSSPMLVRCERVQFLYESKLTVCFVGEEKVLELSSNLIKNVEKVEKVSE